MGYHNRTDLAGQAPKCPDCGQPMSSADDHGRFICLCRGMNLIDGETGEDLTPLWRRNRPRIGKRSAPAADQQSTPIDPATARDG